MRNISLFIFVGGEEVSMVKILRTRVRILVHNHISNSKMYINFYKAN